MMSHAYLCLCEPTVGPATIKTVLSDPFQVKRSKKTLSADIAVHLCNLEGDLNGLHGTLLKWIAPFGGWLVEIH